MTRISPPKPLVAIVGATGTGKSELAVALAQRFNGEVINGDAMQLYVGLPVITNKIPVEEQHGIPHHLLGRIGLQEQTWVVGTFVRECLRVVEDIHSRGKLPILVGGTHYYTQALLFQGGLAEEEGAKRGAENGDEEPRHEMLDLPTEELLRELEKVDPVMAARWHPNDRRKIQRSLELYLKTGKKASEIYAGQRAEKLGVGEGLAEEAKASMRFPTLIFCTHANNEALRERLDQRVERMISNGLLDEVKTLRDHATSELASGQTIDETRGIWVSIGYKEFKDYAAALDQGEAKIEDLEKLKQEAVEKTQAATRQYSKRQLRWIRIKLLNALADAQANDHMFVLDSSDVSAYNESVVEPAALITTEFLQAAPMPEPTSLSPLAAEVLQAKRDYDLSTAPEKWIKQHCDVCGVTCVTPDQWTQHTRSRAHRRLVSKRKEERARKAAGKVEDSSENG